jgi:hypothetical protein
MNTNTTFRPPLAIAQCVVALTLAIGSAAAFAQTATPGIDQRQSNQSARIAKGEQTGALSKREAARMKAGQQKVTAMKANAAAPSVKPSNASKTSKTAASRARSTTVTNADVCEPLQTVAWQGSQVALEVLKSPISFTLE